MSILCLWNIQLTLDWDRIEHILINQSLSAASMSRICFNPTIFAEVIATLEPARSMQMGKSKQYVSRFKSHLSNSFIFEKKAVEVSCIALLR